MYACIYLCVYMYVCIYIYTHVQHIFLYYLIYDSGMCPYEVKLPNLAFILEC